MYYGSSPVCSVPCIVAVPTPYEAQGHLTCAALHGGPLVAVDTLMPIRGAVLGEVQ